MVALMTERLEVSPEHTVLEIGTGSGYQTAILSRLARAVWSIERVKPLLDAAFDRLHDLGVKNVHFRYGDGTLGWPEAAPFDRILIAAGAPGLPRDLLLAQLRDGGIAVLPVGSEDEQMLLAVRRRGDELISEEVCPCRFVKLIGAMAGKTSMAHAERETTSALALPVESLDQVGPSRAKALKLLGVRTLGDLLEYFPRNYQYESSERGIDQLVTEQIQTARGQVVAVDYVPIRPRPRFEATIDDGAGKLGLVWFNGAYLRRTICPGMMIRVQGKVRFYRNVPQMVNPRWHAIADDEPPIQQSAFRPIYPATAKLASEAIHRVIDQNLDAALAEVHEWFEPDLLEKRGLMDRRTAYHAIHRPRDNREAMSARRRIVYDELMLMQLGLGISKRLRDRKLTAPILRGQAAG